MNYQLELRHLKYFLAVAEELHFRKAADRLYISQPGLSRQIKQLETSTGTQLFVRHNRKVQLTKAGLYLKKELQPYLKGLDHMLRHAQLLSEGQVGDLRFGYVGSAMQQIIPQLLLSLKSSFPEVHFSLKELENDKQIAGLLANDLDIGFIRLDRVPRGLKTKKVLEEPFCLVLPADHPVIYAGFEDLTQCRHEPFILFDPAYSPSYYEKVMQIFDTVKFTPIVAHNTVHAGSIYKLVENGFGISIVPLSLTTNIENSSSIKYIVLDQIPQRTKLSAVWNPDSWNPMLKPLLDLLTEISIP